MNKKQEKRIRLKKKIRTKIFGTSTRPRLSVFRSNSFIYAQIIDDNKGSTIASASDLKAKKGLPAQSGNKTEKAKAIGLEIAQKAIEKKIKEVVFDRNGFKYTGRIKALADSAREGGLKF
jgi:large subunit ribosomal protein L18